MILMIVGETGPHKSGMPLLIQDANNKSHQHSRNQQPPLPPLLPPKPPQQKQQHYNTPTGPNHETPNTKNNETQRFGLWLHLFGSPEASPQHQPLLPSDGQRGRDDVLNGSYLDGQRRWSLLRREWIWKNTSEPGYVRPLDMKSFLQPGQMLRGNQTYSIMSYGSSSILSWPLGPLSHTQEEVPTYEFPANGRIMLAFSEEAGDLVRCQRWTWIIISYHIMSCHIISLHIPSPSSSDVSWTICHFSTASGCWCLFVHCI